MRAPAARLPTSSRGPGPQRHVPLATPPGRTSPVGRHEALFRTRGGRSRGFSTHAKAHETETGQRPRLSRGGSWARHRPGLHGHLPRYGRPACVPWPNFIDGIISFIRKRCAPGLNWPGRASGAVTLKKLECSKQAYALYTLAWDNIIGFRSYCVGLRDRTFAKDVFINQERKLGARRRSDTVLVSTINDADQGSADVAFRTPLAPYEKSKSLGSGGEYGRKAET
ncbi:hypothetical protein HN51_051734 [Arachis hypogaea]